MVKLLLPVWRVKPYYKYGNEILIEMKISNTRLNIVFQFYSHSLFGTDKSTSFKPRISLPGLQSGYP